MPVTTATHAQSSPLLIETISANLSEQAALLFVQQAKERVQNMLNQENHIVQMQSNLSVLMERYFLQKSLVDSTSEWYGQRPWWNKTLAAIAFVTLSALIGAIINLAAVLSVVALGIYWATSYVLDNHHTISTVRCDRLASDIKELESALQLEVDELTKIEGTLKQVLISIAESQVRNAENTAAFEQTIVNLSTQIGELTTSIKALGEAKDKLLANNEQLAAQVTLVKDQLKSAQADLKNKVSELDELNERFNSMDTQLSQSSLGLENVEIAYRQRVSALGELEERFKEQLVKLTESSQKENLVRTSQDSHSSASSIQSFMTSSTNKIINLSHTSLAKGQREMDEFSQLLAEPVPVTPQKPKQSVCKLLVDQEVEPSHSHSMLIASH